MSTGNARTDTLEQLARSFKTAMAAVRRLRGRETHHPGEPATRSTGCCSGSRTGPAPSSQRESSPARQTCHRQP